MKTTKLTALLLASALFAGTATGCLDNTDTSSKAPSPAVSSGNDAGLVEGEISTTPIGTIQLKGNIGDEFNENDMVFKLNSVIDADYIEDGNKFIFFDITIKNNTSKAYTLSTLNNFYLVLPDGSEEYSSIRTLLYARSTFSDKKYFPDPFDIPSNGQFSGVIGGFIINKDINDFTVCFFPTGDDPRNKEKVIRIDVAESDIQKPSSDLLDRKA